MTDNDTGTAFGPAKVNVTWHLPYEKTQDLGSVPHKTLLRLLVGPLAPGEGAAKVSTPAQDFDFGAAIDDVAVLTGTNPEIIEIIKAISSLSELVLHFAGTEEPTPANFWRNDDGSWVPNTTNYPDGIDGATPEELGDPYGYRNFNMEIYQVKHYHHITWLADKHGHHGFESADHTLSLDQVDSIEQEPHYFRRPEY